MFYEELRFARTTTLYNKNYRESPLGKKIVYQHIKYDIYYESFKWQNSQFFKIFRILIWVWDSKKNNIDQHVTLHKYYWF